jgi:hypothetical protein
MYDVFTFVYWRLIFPKKTCGTHNVISFLSTEFFYIQEFEIEHLSLLNGFKSFITYMNLLLILNYIIY